MILKQYLIQILTEALARAGLPGTDIQISASRDSRFGDFNSNLALMLSKTARQSPLATARTIHRELHYDGAIIGNVTISPPGFLNFFINPDYYRQNLAAILEQGAQYSRSGAGHGKTANVEFVSANPTGPLTVGHGRQAVLGDCIANILEWHGYEVTREYYYNDAGRQMRLLAESVEARYFQLLGEDRPLPDDGYQGEYIRDIAQALIDRHGPALPAGDPRFGQEAEATIFQSIKSSLQSLGIVHQRFSNEKDFYASGAIREVLRLLQEKNALYESQGATWFRTSQLGKDQDKVLIKSSGEPTYRLPDIAYHRDKLERGYTLVIDLFGADHTDTYPDILSALSLMGYDTARVRVLIHQFVTLIRGGEKVKMSTRKATFVTLEDLVQRVGPDVVRYFFIMRGMSSHLNFDLDLAEDESEKNPVYYLQYAFARICNIIRHGRDRDVRREDAYDAALLADPTELDLLKMLADFPELMLTVLETLEPQLIANYLHGLATNFHKFYTECRVITGDAPLTQARLALVAGVKTVLGNGLGILGLRAPERM